MGPGGGPPKLKLPPWGGGTPGPPSPMTSAAVNAMGLVGCNRNGGGC